VNKAILILLMLSVLPGLMQPAKSIDDSVQTKEPGAQKASAALREQADELVRQESFDRAEAKYTQAIEADAGLAWAWAGRAQARLQLNKAHTALQDINKAIELEPQSATHFARRALVNAQLGAQLAANKDVATALKLEPKNKLALKAKAKVARKHETTPARAPNSARAAATKAFADGIQCERNGDIRGAVAKYNEAIALDPTLPYPYATRGKARLDLKELKGARADLDKAIALTPDNSDLYSNRALLEREEGNFEDAIVNMTFAIKLAPKEANYYVQRALMYVAKNDLANGRADLTKALEINPGNELALAMKKKLEDKSAH
jgi:tetratricopeptide (TPR) repeat protein